MSNLRDVTADHRFEQGFASGDGVMHRVWADYADQGGTRAILHVEADDALRGSGAAGQFMAQLAEHARSRSLKLRPRCSYAVAWHRRHPDYDDVLAA